MYKFLRATAGRRLRYVFFGTAVVVAHRQWHGKERPAIARPVFRPIIEVHDGRVDQHGQGTLRDIETHMILSLASCVAAVTRRATFGVLKNVAVSSQ